MFPEISEEEAKVILESYLSLLYASANAEWTLRSRLEFTDAVYNMRDTCGNFATLTYTLWQIWTTIQTGRAPTAEDHAACEPDARFGKQYAEFTENMEANFPEICALLRTKGPVQ